MTNIIDLSMKEKVYRKRSSRTSILQDFCLTVAEREKVAIIGESGVGKSSLLNILGLIDTAYSGSYTLFGTCTRKLSSREMSTWRNQKIGFVLQESALINSLTIEDNIKLPMLYSRSLSNGESRSFEDIVDSIGIGYILKKKPLECSGGEKARAVFARAVIMNPDLILADEPTSSLDSENKSKIINLLLDMNRNFGSTLVTVTHDAEFAQQHDRVISLKRKVR
ncbi:ABC transporter ATP-binding protein [Devriesea agamarum]|uniref:ABC transporter ATP-binding protein n=1 Tax=Devriesea agamarum TaxID=472569 RepID=UPI00071C5A38|nr:ABC transporter ATP-binding protein [Devriesea agamarum]